MVRNPVDVMYSWHQILYSAGDETTPSFEDALAAENERKQGHGIPPKMYLPVEALYYREVVDFTPQIKRYHTTFGRENVHVIVYDDFKVDTQKTYREALEFLGVDTDVAIDFTVVNESYIVRSRWLMRLLRDPIIVRIGEMIAPIAIPLYKYLRRQNTVPQQRMPLDPTLRQQLLDELRPQIDELGALLERDLSDWFEHKKDRKLSQISIERNQLKL